MQQSNPGKSGDPFVVIFEADNAAEAVVLRGLLESAGFESPQPSFTDPFPGAFAPIFTHDSSILARASQADEARQLIASQTGGESDC